MGRSSITPKNNNERIRNLETKIHQMRINQTYLKLEVLQLGKKFREQENKTDLIYDIFNNFNKISDEIKANIESQQKTKLKKLTPFGIDIDNGVEKK